MNPAYQGQIDVFCAAYAVINAMRRIHGTRLLGCRELLHEALLDAAGKPEFFAALLKQQTDYVDWVDAMLGRLTRKGMLHVETPYPDSFPGPDAVPPAELWTTLERWLSGNPRRAVVFQFVRHLVPAQIVIRHWTCGCTPQEDVLPLFDSSLEPGAVHAIDKDALSTDESRGVAGKILIVPYTVRLLRAKTERRMP